MLLRRQDHRRRLVRTANCFHAAKACGFQPLAILAHREYIAVRAGHKHVEPEQHRQLRPGSLIVRDELRDEQPAPVLECVEGSLDQFPAVLAPLAVDDVPEDHEVEPLATEVRLAQVAFEVVVPIGDAETHRVFARNPGTPGKSATVTRAFGIA